MLFPHREILAFIMALPRISNECLAPDTGRWKIWGRQLSTFRKLRLALFSETLLETESAPQSLTYTSRLSLPEWGRMQRTRMRRSHADRVLLAKIEMEEP